MVSPKRQEKAPLPVMDGNDRADGPFAHTLNGQAGRPMRVILG